MPQNYSDKDLHRPIIGLYLFTIIAIGMVAFGGFVLVKDALINGLTTERVTQFYGGWGFFLIVLGIGVLFLWYAFHNMAVIRYRQQNKKNM